MDWKKIWDFIWHDDSVASWVVNVILAFILIKFLILPGLGFIMDTSHPVVAVVSGSMEHKFTQACFFNNCNTNQFTICGQNYRQKERIDFDRYWEICGERYEDLEIPKDEFNEFSFKNGFNTGDIMIIGSPDNIEIGDIAVFWDGVRQYPLIHRIVKLNDTHFTTLGDHNPGFIKTERNVERDKIIGKALFRIPFLGNIKIWFVELIDLFRG